MTDNEPTRAARLRHRIRLAFRNRAARVAVAAALAVSGCGAPPFAPDPRDLTCNSAEQCRVEVTVNCAQGACRLAVDHPHVFARGNSVVWSIVNQSGQSYKFADDSGVAFKTEPGRSVFRCHVEANGARIGCMNRGTPGTFEYGVRVSGTPPVPPLDPWVVNH